MPIKKIYIIEVRSTNKSNKGLWYASKYGEQFEAEIKARGYDDCAGFAVSNFKFIRPEDCIVISERLIEVD